MRSPLLPTSRFRLRWLVILFLCVAVVLFLVFFVIRSRNDSMLSGQNSHSVTNIAIFPAPRPLVRPNPGPSESNSDSLTTSPSPLPTPAPSPSTGRLPVVPTRVWRDSPLFHLSSTSLARMSSWDRHTLFWDSMFDVTPPLGIESWKVPPSPPDCHAFKVPEWRCLAMKGAEVGLVNRAAGQQQQTAEATPTPPTPTERTKKVGEAAESESSWTVGVFHTELKGLEARTKKFLEWSAKEDVFSYETIRRDMCLSQTKRMQRRAMDLDLLPQRASKQEKEPVKVFFSNNGWKPSYFGTTKGSFQGCSVNCEVVPTQRNADIMVGLMWCDRRAAMPTQFGKPANGKKVAFFSQEALFESHLMTELPPIVNRCLEQVDYVIGHSSLSDIRVFYDDMDSYFFGMPDFTKKLASHAYMDDYQTRLQQALSTKKSAEEGLAAHFIGVCNDKPIARHYYRTEYLGILDEQMTIHGYGGCAKHVVKEPVFDREKEWKPDRRLARKVQITPQYKFILAFENSAREGYVTEKFWEGLLCPFTVMVYFGDFEVHRFIPEEIWRKYKLFVNANFFPDPHDLVDYLLYLDRNETAYREYFQWRLDGVQLFDGNPKRARPMDPTRGLVKNVDGENVSPFCRLCELYVKEEVNPNMEIKEWVFHDG